jgi:hypothetical protein
MNYKINFYILHHPEDSYAHRKTILLDRIAKHNIPYKPIWIENFKPCDIDNHNFPSYKTNIQNFSLTLKHKYALNEFINSNVDYAIICEDDINIDCVTNFSEFIQNCLKEFTETHGDMCFFGGIYPFFVSNPVPNQYLYYGYTTRCTHGYIISRHCAQKIIDQFHFNENIDHMYNGIIEKNNLKCAWTYPHLSQ